MKEKNLKAIKELIEKIQRWQRASKKTRFILTSPRKKAKGS